VPRGAWICSSACATVYLGHGGHYRLSLLVAFISCSRKLCRCSVLGESQWLGPGSPHLAWKPLATGKKWLGPIC
jgi:hypothetical protein